MNDLAAAAEPIAIPLQLTEETTSLIEASLAENTQKAYQHALQKLETWLVGQTLSDPLLADYITALHENGKSPATIGQVVAAAKWQLKHQPNTPTANAYHASHTIRYPQKLKLKVHLWEQ